METGKYQYCSLLFYINNIIIKLYNNILRLKQVCFSDESVFQVMSDKSQFVRRRPGEEYHPDCIIPRVKHPTSIMVWSVINFRGTGRLQIVQGTMRQDQYKKILEERLLPQLNEWFGEGEEPIFMHDGAPCHKAKTVSKFLADKNITVLDWPGNSPDMNPIENVWELMKREISKATVTTKQELIEKLIDVWHRNEHLQEVVKSCAESMPQRIAALIAAKGGHTKY